MKYGKTDIVISESKEALGQTAADAVAGCMRECLAGQDEISMIFAAGESQIQFLDALAIAPDIDWQRVVCLNMDDFWEPAMPFEYTCCHQTKIQLYDKVKPKRVELFRYDATDPQQEADRFADLMKTLMPIDILCQGVGTSGHLALDEPGEVDFKTDVLVKVVNVDEQSKKQLISDPNFMAYGKIPDKGITMTIPAMLRSRNIFTIVPLALKKPIITRLLQTPEPTIDLPASILSQHKGTLFLDRDSCPD